MTLLAIELDDRALAVARAGEVLGSAPSAVFQGSNGPLPGRRAWDCVRSHPTAVSTDHLGTVLRSGRASTRAATLVQSELACRLTEHPLTPGERLWIAAPAYSDERGLGRLLGIARSQALPVDGFIDSAVATVAALGLRHNAIVLEVGLHHAAATAVDATAGQARRRRAVLAQRGGLMEIYQAWLELIRSTMVKRTRFDPLHEATIEQELFDSLPQHAGEAAALGHTTVQASQGAEHFRIVLSRDQFAAAAGPIYRRMLGLLHELRPAGSPVAIILARAIAELPGLREELQQFAECELVGTPAGLAAAAVSLLALPEHAAQATVPLLRRLPLRELNQLAQQASREPLGKQRVGAAVPSHVLFNGRAFALAAPALVVGRAADPAGDSAGGTKEAPAVDGLAPPAFIGLPDGLAGVSRRHCTFVHDGGELVLLDHSSFGTFVNGERVSERVRLRAGDRVRVGTPGVELDLIAVGDTAVTS